jgi:hypothetical protein
MAQARRGGTPSAKKSVRTSCWSSRRNPKPLCLRFCVGNAFVHCWLGTGHAGQRRPLRIQIHTGWGNPGSSSAEIASAVYARRLACDVLCGLPSEKSSIGVRKRDTCCASRISQLYAYRYHLRVCRGSNTDHIEFSLFSSDSVGRILAGVRTAIRALGPAGAQRIGSITSFRL